MATPRGRGRGAVEPTHFLNVDLEIEGRTTQVAALIAELDRKLLQLHAEAQRGRTRASYEILRQAHSVDQTIAALAAALERLSPAARRGWRAARIRDFNVGIQAGREPHAVELAIDAKNVERVAALGGRIVITVYAPFPRPAAGKIRARGR